MTTQWLILAANPSQPSGSEYSSVLATGALAIGGGFLWLFAFILLVAAILVISALLSKRTDGKPSL